MQEFRVGDTNMSDIDAGLASAVNLRYQIISTRILYDLSVYFNPTNFGTDTDFKPLEASQSIAGHRRSSQVSPQISQQSGQSTSHDAMF